MSTTPVTTEVGNTNVKSDAEKAIAQLNALAEKQHRTFEQVFLDPEYKALATATYQRSSPLPLTSISCSKRAQK
jgi:16S rRNA G966 N2-methylase RsmD